MKYQICIDLTECGVENIPLISSPYFDSEEEADNWYRKLFVHYADLDIIMVIYNDDFTIADTYVY